MYLKIWRCRLPEWRPFCLGGDELNALLGLHSRRTHRCIGLGIPIIHLTQTSDRFIIILIMMIPITVRRCLLREYSKFKIQKRFIETHIHIQKWYIKFLCHSTESDSSLRYINSTLDNMCINEGREKPGSLYGPHYDAWSVPDSDITRANVDPAWDGGTHAGPTLGQVTPPSGNRILYWSYDVAYGFHSEDFTSALL